MNVLIVGGSHFVGRAFVETARREGHDVTVLNRGLTGHAFEGVRHLRVDRTDHDRFTQAVGNESWDAVIDTWSGAPVEATFAASLLGLRSGHYGFVSSRSVYQWPIAVGSDESHPTVDGDPQGDTADDYAKAKRGAELGVLATCPDALIARAGLILGPYEDVGRLPWWLSRMERGGRTLAPGPQSRPLQYIDARDLAAWMISSAQAHKGGIFNTASPPGHTTIGELLSAAREVTGSQADLVWFTPEEIEAAGLAPWTELPIWLPPTGELAGLHDGDVRAAVKTGLHCRSIRETVEDTWAWLQTEGAAGQRSDRPTCGLDPTREAELLDQRHSSPS